MTFWHPLPTHRLLAEISLWSADLANLASEIKRIEPYTDLFHIDVADAHFVPGLLFFPDLVAALRPHTPKPFHVHLMVDQPLTLIDAFAEAGADLITVHVENGEAVAPALAKIRHANCRAGLALGLDVAPDVIIPHLSQIDIVVMMGTALGVKGQGLSTEACPWIATLRHLLVQRGYAKQVKIAADGGIRENTVPRLRAAGADTVVMGSLAFQSPDPATTFQWLHSLPTPFIDTQTEENS